MRIDAVERWRALARKASDHALAKGGVKVPVAFILGVIHQESHGDPRATSKHGAQGLMQLMPATAEWLGVDNAYDPEENVKGGTMYLAKLMKQFPKRLDLVAAAYNAGPGAVKRAGNTIPNNPETRKYVPLVLGYMNDYQNL